MKKRIRKKLHVGEFKQNGNVIILNSDGEAETAETILSKLELVLDEHSLTATGGGCGRIIIPSKQGNKYIPEIAGLIVSLVTDGMLPADEMMFCIYKKGANEVPQEALDAIKETFADEKFKLKIGRSIDLWDKKGLQGEEDE